eukprot:4006472-Prymnesium_polylepis.1
MDGRFDEHADSPPSSEACCVAEARTVGVRVVIRPIHDVLVIRLVSPHSEPRHPVPQPLVADPPHAVEGMMRFRRWFVAAERAAHSKKISPHPRFCFCRCSHRAPRREARDARRSPDVTGQRLRPEGGRQGRAEDLAVVRHDVVLAPGPLDLEPLQEMVRVGLIHLRAPERDLVRVVVVAILARRHGEEAGALERVAVRPLEPIAEVAHLDRRVPQPAAEQPERA